MCGGTVAAWAREGTEVHYACITDGSAGSNEPGAVREEIARTRERELREACEVLGVRSVSFLGFVDGSLELTMDLRRAVTREVRRIRPDVLVGPDPSRRWARGEYINHPDHRVAGEAVLCAVNPDAPTRPQFSELLDEGFEPFEVPSLWLTAEDADTFVDVTETIDVKIEALGRHRSQLAGFPAEELVRDRARELGARAGMEYAEGFRTFALVRPDDGEEATLEAAEASVEGAVEGADG
ncbi:MAG: PIG-L family deacetylase [Actinobacteria bacterium]|nr:PIG-L family deacetylase [Actinomycetota bacterium]